MRAVVSLFIALCCSAALSPVAMAHKIVLKDGRIVQFEKYRTTEDLLLYTDGAGKEVRIALKDIDFDRTRELSASDNPPLDLPGLILSNRTQVNTGSQSLGDIAKKLRNPESKAQHVFTDDDVAHSDFESSGDAHTATGQLAIDYSQVEILGLSCEALGRTVLRAVDPKLDVGFPGRGEWESSLCRDREQWKMQYDRYVGHKGTATEAHERDLAADAYKLLQTRSWEGPALARRFIRGDK